MFFREQDYKSLAKRVKKEPLSGVRRFVAQKLAGYFIEDNPKFDYDKFMKDCNVR